MKSVSVIEACLGREALHHTGGRSGHGPLLVAELAVHVHLELLPKHLDDEVRVAILLPVELDVGNQSCLWMEFVPGIHVFVFYS